MKVTYSDLNNKRILVTGATSGIGKQIIINLLEQGAQVIAHARQAGSKVEAVSKEIDQINADFNQRLEWCYFELDNLDQMKESIDALLEHGPIEGLVNNAGMANDQLLMRMKSTDINHLLNVNLNAAIHLTQLLSKNFLRAQDVSIVHISSIVGMMGNTAQTVYAASKAGLIGFSKSLAKELASRNIRSNVIAPGFIETKMSEAINEKAKEHYLNNIPLKRFGATKEVSTLACFLLSSASSYITGEVIKVDGGLYI
jgi:3-oxoacyl-[acyl-carrier protein] reductase